MSTSTINYIQINDSECEEGTNHEKLSQKREEHEENPTKNLILPIKIKGELSESTQKRRKKGGSEERSWIWNYYEKLDPKPPYVRIVKCQVEVYGKKGLQPCGKIMNSKDYSTSNYINHLNTAHSITKEIHYQKTKEQ